MKRHLINLALSVVLFLNAKAAVADEVAAAPAMTPGASAQVVTWTGDQPPSDQDQQELAALGGDRTLIESYVTTRPDSPWTPALRNRLANAYRRAGRNSLALSHWDSAWNRLKDTANPAGKEEANHAVAGQVELLSRLGRLEPLRLLLQAAEGRPMATPEDRRRTETAREAYLIMRDHPGLSYRCGSLALANIARQLGKPASVVDPLIEEPSTENGLTLARLIQLSQQSGMGLVAVRRTDSAPVPVPSVVHWSLNHFGAVLEYRADLGYYRVADPTFVSDQWISAADLEAESSGYFLVPENQRPAGWQSVLEAETRLVFGRGYPYNINDARDKGCKISPTNPRQVCVPCSGMPAWWVTEPYINVWFADEPVSYTTSRGEQMAFRLTIKQRDSPPSSFSYSPPGFLHNWYSKIYFRGLSSTLDPTNGFSDWTATLYLPTGGERTYTKSALSDVESNTQLQPACGVVTDGTVVTVPGLPFTGTNAYLAISGSHGITNQFMPVTNAWYDAYTGFRVFNPDGSVDRYGVMVWRTNTTAGIYDAEALLTSRTDPLGNETELTYECYANCGNPETIQYRLTKVTDYDGKTLTFQYASNPAQLSGVTTSYGQSAAFAYDTNGNLNQITDAAGLISTLNWDTQGRVSQLITPSGTNTFNYYSNTIAGQGNIGGHNAITRAVAVTDANGGTNLYAFRFDCSAFYTDQYATNILPQSTPWGTLDTGTIGASTNFAAVSFRNSFHWDPRQCAALTNLVVTNSALVVTNLTATDYQMARMRHWLGDANNLTVLDCLSVEQAPSADGTTAGQLSFYDYAGKSLPYLQGTNYQIGVVARRQPAGATEYNWSRYNDAGFLTNLVTTYSLSDGISRTRTQSWIYANNTIAFSNKTVCPFCTVGSYMASCTQAPITLPSGYTLMFAPVGVYKPNTNYFSQCTWPNLLIAAINPDGTSNSYGGYQAAAPISSSGCGASHQVTHSYTPPLPGWSTNAAGYISSSTYDAANRIKTNHSASGLTTSFLYDSTGFLTNITTIEIGRTNSFTYINGLVAMDQDELGRRTTNFWDGLQRLTGYADSEGSVSNIYTALDLTATRDKRGHWSYFGYDGLRNLTSFTDANGAISLAQYCQCGALESTRDALSNYTHYYYDRAGRMTNVVYPDGYARTNTFNALDQLTQTADAGSTNTLTYNLQGLATSATNSTGILWSNNFDVMDRPIAATDSRLVTSTLAYDKLGRVLTNIVAGVQTNRFTYSSNGLVQVTDTLGRTSFLTNDTAGRLLAQKNADNELTQYQYDPAGNLTGLVDGNLHQTTFLRDAFGRLTSKLDHTSNSVLKLTYYPGGDLQTRWTPAKGTNWFLRDAMGRVLTNTYPSDTPIVFRYDGNGRVTNMLDASGVTGFSYTPSGQLQGEAGPWANSTVALAYTNGTRSSLTLTQPGASQWEQTYGYDASPRLQTVASPAGLFTYGYAANSASALVQTIALPNAAVITNHYDNLSRLDATVLLNYWGHALDGYNYIIDAAGQRTSVTRNLGLTTSSVSVGYDNISQLTSWTGSESNGTARLNEQLTYGYDAGHNLISRINGGLTQAFNPDARNELTNITRSGTLTWSGSLPAPAVTVTVNSVAAQTNGDFTFASSGLTLSNGVNTFTVIAANALGLHTTNTFTRNLPVSVNLQYDADGNLLTDGARCFAWSDSGQLTAVYVTNQWKSAFLRDGLGRVRVASDFGWQSSAWVQTNETHFIYDGQLLLQERDAANNVQVTYTRGLDLGGSFAGAGGIGGLLARTDAQYATNSPLRQNYYHSDAAGNVTALLDGNENVAARYLYDPFGRLLGQWGSLANANRMQFSSMPHHGNSGLTLYPFRAYDPVLQRWLSRDPIGEGGGIDLYAFAGNSPLNAVDSDGRVLHILAGAAAGALIGGGFSIASDLWHGRDVDWVQAGISATEGAIAGAVASATFGTSLAGSGLALAARGAAAGLAGDLAAQGAGLAAQTRQCFSIKEAGLSTLLGAGGPLAGKLLGKFAARFAKDEIVVVAETTTQLTPAELRKLYPRVTPRRSLPREVWERSKAPNGKVYDPTGVEIKPGDYWELGHRPGHQIPDARLRAAQEGWDRTTWRQYQNDPDIYRPELKPTNRSHAHESDW